MSVEPKFLTSAATAAQFPRFEKPVVAVAGKSNSGKSTFINMLAGRKGLARTGAAPGRTRLVNYFDFGTFVLADLPGYGYAAVSKQEKEKWAKTLDAFFSTDVSHVLVLSDIRRDPSADDETLLTFLNYHRLPFTVVATKCDKLSRMKQKERARAVANALSLGVDNVLVCSGVTGQGKDEILSRLGEIVSLSQSNGDTPVS